MEVHVTAHVITGTAPSQSFALEARLGSLCIALGRAWHRANQPGNHVIEVPISLINGCPELAKKSSEQYSWISAMLKNLPFIHSGEPSLTIKSSSHCKLRIAASRNLVAPSGITGIRDSNNFNAGPC